MLRLVLLSMGSFVFLIGFNDSTMLYGLDETKNAQCAREMLARHDWIVPTFNGELRTDKPPLHYYVMMLAYRLFGVNGFAARLGSGLMGALVILMTFRMAERNLSRQAATWSALVLLASLHFSVQFRMSVPDPYLIACLTLAFWSGYEALKTGKAKWALATWMGMGLGALAKGPVALLLPVLTAVAYLTVSRQWSWSKVGRLRPFSGILLFALVTLPWYWAVHQQTDGAWTQGFFMKHNVGRYAAAMEGHGGFFGLPVLYVLVGLLPFSAFLPQALRRAVQQRRENSFGLFCLTVAGVIVGFFMFSGTKLPNYTVPAYPFLAVLLGDELARLTQGWRTAPATRISFNVVAVIMLLLPAGIALALYLDPHLSHVAWAGGLFMLLPMGVLLMLHFLRRQHLRPALLTIAGAFMVSAWVLYGLAYPVVDRENPVQVTLPSLAGRQPVVGYKHFNPAFVFYLNRCIPLLETPEQLHRQLLAHPETRVISRTDHLVELSSLPYLLVVHQRRDLFERPTTVILERRESISQR
ncbi:glycosyltransferase family 39 protein [Nibrella saemangeumensis]|uniref:Glycosyltransferase family 39 protein n=1 Tax=Nibrella saemangeumensis TaxID=1084526 RepID=A0ABP8NGB9_9BACT